MAVLSVDLAYKDYAGIGAVVLEHRQALIQCELLRLPLTGVPSPKVLAEYLNAFCLQKGVYILLLDGPQGWKAKCNGLRHCRRCERELNTPAKTGEPFSVKPANYTDFVRFSIAVYDALGTHGWERLAMARSTFGPTSRALIESFPLSAWRSLRISPLPAKAKTRPEDLVDRIAKLQEVFPLRLSGTPTHDELQALVSGLAGLAIELNRWNACAVAGLPPTEERQYWREGFIVNLVHPDAAFAPE